MYNVAPWSSIVVNWVHRRTSTMPNVQFFMGKFILLKHYLGSVENKEMYNLLLKTQICF